MNSPVYFVSDTHFKYHNINEAEKRKKQRFFKFLSEIEGAERLYLVGDIFDFWFEYRHVIPGSYWEILYRLQLLRESGTDIYITGGNHDFWLGSFISEVMKFHILPQFSIQNLQGRRIAVTHGDMILPGDRGYKILKRIIRNKIVIGIARMVHPDLLFAFARIFSSTSKDFTGRKTDYWAERVTGIARDNFFEWDNDAFIMGHVHKPVLRRFGENVFCILGDWEENCSYLKIEEGEFSAGSYNEDGNTFMEKR